MILTTTHFRTQEDSMPTIKPEDLTMNDLIGLGLDAGLDKAVNDRLPTALLVEATRRYVAQQVHLRERQRNRAVEQRAWGEASTKIRMRVHQAATEAAAEQEVVWADVIDVPIGEGGEGQTWGSATADDHGFAAERAETVASGHVQRAAMHRRAAADLEAGGFRTLAESTMGLE